jgi:hypothetical protein
MIASPVLKMRTGRTGKSERRRIIRIRLNVRAPIDLDGTALFIANTRICKERKEMKKGKNGFLPLCTTTCHLTSRKKDKMI